jgi:hypothetical protein
MINSAAQGEKAFKRVGDVGLDLLGGHAVVESGHQHHGNIDRGKHIHWHLNYAGDSQHADEKAKNNDEIGMFD